MTQGEVVELDDVYNIFTNPQHDFTKSLVNHTINLDLPSRFLLARKKRILKIVYSGERAEESVISDTIKSFNVQLNIIHGKIEYISNKPFGILIIQLEGKPDNIANAEKYLKLRTFEVEVIND